MRSLGRRGIPVRVVKTDEHVLAAWSRYAHGNLRLPDAGDEEQAAFLLDLAAREGLDGWVLMPTDDHSAALVARRSAELARVFRFSTPGWDVLRWADDKRLTDRLGQEADVPVPRTVVPGDASRLDDLDIAFPAILKPASKQPGDRLSAEKAWRVDDAAQLRARYAEASRSLPAGTVMVQELIPGGGSEQLSYGALCADGEVVASIQARRLRQRPMDFGKASTYVRSEDEGEAAELGQRLLAHLRYTGLVEVEFKRDPRDGRLKLLDVNPRAWGWQSLGAAAGVDFAYLEWRLAQGLPVERVRASPGVAWVRMAMDLPTAVGEIRARRLAVRHYLTSVLRGPRAAAIFAADDPLPVLVDLPILAWIRARRR